MPETGHRPAGSVERLLLAIRRAVGPAGPRTTVARGRLARIANRPGAGALLLRTVREGDILAAHVASFALPLVNGELVRRALRRAAHEVKGERRAAVLASLTDDELDQVLSELGDELDEDLAGTSAILAANSPREFVELLCDGLPAVDERIVDHVERVRRAFGLGAASVYAPLLERRLTDRARLRVIEVLGREPGPDVAQVLDRLSARAAQEDERRVLRRERMRQASAELAGRPQPEGCALLGALGRGGSASLDLFELAPSGLLVRTSVSLGHSGVTDCITSPAPGGLDEAVRAADPGGLRARMTLGQARGLLESRDAASRAELAPLLERLSRAPAEAPAAPAPGPALAAEEARALIREQRWALWRPFTLAVRWPSESLAAAAGLSAADFPCSSGMLDDHVAAELVALKRRRLFLARIAAGIRHNALVMHLRGDARAAAVAAEALWLARGRWPALARALLERELWLQLWANARLPETYRSRIRDAVRQSLDRSEAPVAGWDRVRTLDLAQAAAEGLARAAGENAERPGLPAPESLDLGAALELAALARESLTDESLRRRARAGTFRVIAEEAGAWLAGPPAHAAWEMARFAGEMCLHACPHRCFDGEPEQDPEAVADGACAFADRAPP